MPIASEQLQAAVESMAKPAMSESRRLLVKTARAINAQATETNQLLSAESTTRVSASALWKSSDTQRGVPKEAEAPTSDH